MLGVVVHCNMASHYVIMYTATAGANGPLLGTDEEEIVLMQYLVWDAACRKVVVDPLLLKIYIYTPECVHVKLPG